MVRLFIRTAVIAGSLVIASLAPAHAQTRLQAYALNCIGFSGGSTKAVLEGFITVGRTAVYPVYAMCDSTVSGGASQSVWPAVVGTSPVTNVALTLRTTAHDSTGTTEVGHPVGSGNGFLSGAWMARPAQGQGEAHILISVP